MFAIVYDVALHDRSLGFSLIPLINLYSFTDQYMTSSQAHYPKLITFNPVAE